MELKTMKLGLAAVLATIPVLAAAQKFPERPIRVILGVSPGGGQDTVARAMVPKLTEALGTNIIIDNRPGAGGTIGASLTKQAAPDGYTLMMISSSNVTGPILYGGTYDLQRDFTPVGQLVTQPYLLVVTPSLSVKSVRELIAYAKSNPGNLNFGSAGSGTMTHLAAELFKDQSHIETAHVPYKGMGAVYPDLIAGRIHAAFSTIVSAQGHVRANKLRALGVSSAKRMSSAPDIPTIAEAALPGYAVTQWYGVVAPAGTPSVRVNRLNTGFSRVVNDPEMVRQFAKDGAEAAASTAQEFGAFLRSEQERWARIIKSARLQQIK